MSSNLHPVLNSAPSAYYRNRMQWWTERLKCFIRERWCFWRWLWKLVTHSNRKMSVREERFFKYCHQYGKRKIVYL